MKIKIITLYKYIFLFIFLLSSLPINNFTYYSEVILTISLLIVYLLQKNKKILKPRFLKFFIYFLFIIMIIEVYRYKIEGIFFVSNNALVTNTLCVFFLFLSFPLSELLISDFNSFLRLIIRVGIFLLAVKSISWFEYNFFGINIGFYFLDGKINYTRTIFGLSLERLTDIWFVSIMMSYFTIGFFKAKKIVNKMRNLIYIAFILTYEFLIFQSRSQLIGSIIIILSVSVYYSVTQNNRLMIYILLFSLLIIFGDFIFEYLRNYFSNFSINSTTYGGSNYIRFYENSFYKNLWSENKIWGIGVLPAEIIAPNNLKLFLSDMGLIIINYQYGLIVFFICTIPFLYGIFLSFKYTFLQNDFSRCQGIIVGMTTYLIFMSATALNPYWPTYIFLIVFYISLIFVEHFYKSR